MALLGLGQLAGFAFSALAQAAPFAMVTDLKGDAWTSEHGKQQKLALLSYIESPVEVKVEPSTTLGVTYFASGVQYSFQGPARVALGAQGATRHRRTARAIHEARAGEGDRGRAVQGPMAAPSAGDRRHAHRQAKLRRGKPGQERGPDTRTRDSNGRPPARRSASGSWFTGRTTRFCMRQRPSRPPAARVGAQAGTGTDIPLEGRSPGRR